MKKLASLTATLLFVTCMAACGDNKSEGPASSIPSASSNAQSVPNAEKVPFSRSKAPSGEAASSSQNGTILGQWKTASAIIGNTPYTLEELAIMAEETGEPGDIYTMSLVFYADGTGEMSFDGDLALDETDTNFIWQGEGEDYTLINTVGTTAVKYDIANDQLTVERNNSHLIMKRV